MFYKRENTEQWHDPGTVIGQDGKQILVKHGSTYVRVHTCRITCAINSDQNEIHRTNHIYWKNSGNNESKSHQLKSWAIEIDSSDKELEHPLNNNNININAVNQNNDIEWPVYNNVGDLNKKQGEVNDLTKSISCLSIDENSYLGIVKYDNKHLPSKNEYTEYKTENDNAWNKCQFTSHAGKTTGKYKHYFNVLNLENNSVKDIDWQTIKEWRSLSGLSGNIVNDALLEAKIYEIEKWKENVFEPVKYVGRQTVPSRWVITEKINNGKKVIKTWLVARGVWGG